MDILYVTEMFPTYEKPDLGPFIMRRIHALNTLGHRVVILNLHWETVSGKSFFKRRGKQIYRLFIRKCFIEEMSPEEKGKRLTIHTLYVPKIRYLNKFSLLIALFRYVRKNKYDIVHVHFLWYIYPAYLLKLFFSLPLVLTVHGGELSARVEEPLKDMMKYFSSKKDMMKYLSLIKKIIKKSDRAIFVSRHLLNLSKSYGHETSRSIVLPNGVDKSIFNIDRKGASFSKRKKKYLAYVGHLRPYKGIFYLPLIFFHIKEIYKDALLYIIGGGVSDNDYKIFQNKISDLGLSNNVQIIGALPPSEVSAYMKKIDLLLLPSEMEGYPCVVVEARACGVPVVATDVGGIPEALSEGGLLVKKQADFEKHFADAAVRILKNPPPLEKITANVFSWEEVVQKEIKIYEEILKK